MERHFYDLESPEESSLNYRWMQPPQIAYFISTVDKFGNANLTPVTLGTLVCAQYPRDGKPGEYFFTFSLGCKNLSDPGNALEPRHGFLNLQQNGECVVSYIGHAQMRQSVICNMPIPYGISEFDVAGLTPVQSQKVAAFSIAECAVNMECKVVASHNLAGYYQHYICKVVGLSVDKAALEHDAQNDALGVFAIDPLFEVAIQTGQTGNNRLYYGHMDAARIDRTADDFGCNGDWVGTFAKWIASEQQRGKITAAQAAEILDMADRWLADRNPETNREVKQALSARLKALCQPQ